MRVFVTGTAGQLGHDVVFRIAAGGHTPISSDISQVSSVLPPVIKPLEKTIPAPGYVPMDITDRQAVFL